MARGFTWGDYVDDNGNEWALAVDSDYVSHEERGWTLAGDTGLVPVPRAWRPRRVRGLDSSGRQQFAVVATLNASLWTGATTQFTIRDSQGQPQVVNVIRYEAERRVPVTLDQPEPE